MVLYSQTALRFPNTRQWYLIWCQVYLSTEAIFRIEPWSYRREKPVVVAMWSVVVQ